MKSLVLYNPIVLDNDTVALTKDNAQFIMSRLVVSDIIDAYWPEDSATAIFEVDNVVLYLTIDDLCDLIFMMDHYKPS